MKKNIIVEIILVPWVVLVGLISEGDVFSLSGNSLESVAAWFVLFWTPLILILPYNTYRIISKYSNEVKARQKELKLRKLKKSILRLAFENNKCLSVDEIEIKVDESEEDIIFVLNSFIEARKAEKYISSTGNEIYRFIIDVSCDEKNEIKLN